MRSAKRLADVEGGNTLTGHDEVVSGDDAGIADPPAFEQFTRERRNEIKLHCYRMLGSLSDAEDVTQETFSRAWLAREDLAESALARPWLYRIATNVCLATLRRRKRRRRLWADPMPLASLADLGPPDSTADWLEPMPDSLMSDIADDGPSPLASYEQAEAVRLAFLACVQLLPARQRAVFLLHDVVGWTAAEVGLAFDFSPQAANSLLQRARRTFNGSYGQEPKWAAASEEDQQVAQRYAEALERRDLEAFVSLLRSDVALHMPPWREWLSGKGAIRDFFAFVWQNSSAFRVSLFRANGRWAIAVYEGTAEVDTWSPRSVHVLEVSEGAVVSIVAYVGPLGPACFAPLGLPPTL